MARKKLAPNDGKDLYDSFLDIYNQIDAYMRKQPGVDKYADHSYLLLKTAEKNRIFARYESELKTFANLRNVLVHNPFMSIANPLAKPDERIVDHYSQICKAILNPITAMSIAIPGPQVYTTSLDENTLKLMKLMNQKTYTHVPVIKDDQMIGVFSENTILAYLAHHEEAIITRDLKVVDFADFIGLDKHPSENFEFIKRNALLADVYAIFNEAIKNHKRIGMIFITEHGQPNEKLLGIITAWDLANPEF